jgi:mannose-6-phosphate isomerase-like protein (cupin superfamily)
MKSVAILALSLASCGFALAQSPTSPAEVFAAHDVTAQMGTLADKAAKTGGGGTTLGNYGNHNIQLSVRTTSGGAEVHKQWNDIFYVTSGTATLITGGDVVSPKEAADGETRGTEIQNGKSQTLSPGDVVHIPAGTPHQLIIPKGSTYEAVVVKVREPEK